MIRDVPGLRPKFVVSRALYVGFLMPNAALGFLLAFSCDLATKSLVRGRLGAGSISLGAAGCVRRIESRHHRGSSNQIILVATWCAALICAIVLHLRLSWFSGQGAALGLGAAFGGAAGNLFDVLRGRPIIDFVDLRFWPAFNVADVAIVVGLLMAFLVP